MAARTAASVAIPGPRSPDPGPPFFEHSLHHPDVLLIHRPTGLPTLEHLIPVERLIEQPALLFGIVLAREGIVDDVLLRRRIEMRRHLDVDALAQRHRGRHPGLPQLIVGLALETVRQLALAVLQLIRQAE